MTSGPRIGSRAVLLGEHWAAFFGAESFVAGLGHANTGVLGSVPLGWVSVVHADGRLRGGTTGHQVLGRGLASGYGRRGPGILKTSFMIDSWKPGARWTSIR